MSNFTSLRWLVLAGCILVASPTLGQASGTEAASFMLRMERQTRDEDVCILVARNGQFHLERVALGFDRSRVFEGSFPTSSVLELEQMLDVAELQQLSQSEIKMALIGEELDHVLLAVRRQNGWQSLNFPTGESRKPFRNSLDPLVKWLESVKQQPHPLPSVAPERCMPPQEPTLQTSTASTPPPHGPVNASPSPSPRGSYVLRIVEDHYLPADLTFSAKVERTCVIVYTTGRFRMEKSKQEFNSPMRTHIFKAALSDPQMRELRGIVDAPELVRLQRRTAGAGVTIREGEVINLAIPRGRDTQMLSFASYFGARTQEKGMRDNTRISVDEDVQVVKPLRKWIKANLEETKVRAEDVPATACIPSTQPE